MSANNINVVCFDSKHHDYSVSFVWEDINEMFYKNKIKPVFQDNTTIDRVVVIFPDSQSYLKFYNTKQQFEDSETFEHWKTLFKTDGSFMYKSIYFTNKIKIIDDFCVELLKIKDSYCADV